MTKREKVFSLTAILFIILLWIGIYFVIIKEQNIRNFGQCLYSKTLLKSNTEKFIRCWNRENIESPLGPGSGAAGIGGFGDCPEGANCGF